VKAVRKWEARIREAAARTASCALVEGSGLFIRQGHGAGKRGRGQYLSSYIYTVYQRLHLLVMLKIAIGGTVRPSAAWRARRRAALPCQRTVRAKKRAWLGRRRLTLTNSEKKMRRPWLRCRGADF
jgi:hypothetical protein